MRRDKRNQIEAQDKELQRALESPVGSYAEGFNLDIRLREFEINQLTQRNNFFMIFQGVMIAGITQSLGDASPLVSFLVCLLGMAVSVLQIGMAGGAKYWQMRYEASTRSSELEILLKLLEKRKNAIRTFTHNTDLLSPNERAKVDKWNFENPNHQDQIDNDPEFIHKQIVREANQSKKDMRTRLDRWVKNWAILPKWSVSRIPIWVGAFLFLFWTLLWLHTWQVPALARYWPDLSSYISLTSLK